MVKSRKGQLALGDAPNVVMVVGLVFLVMATIALISQKYGSSLPYESQFVRNESTFINRTGDTLNGKNTADARNFVAVIAINGSSGAVINSGNYTLDPTTGVLTNTSTSAIVWNNVNFSYTYEGHTSVAFNVTGDLNTEIANNTSIAGIILTISLVGIVLTVLLGAFVAIRRNRV